MSSPLFNKQSLIAALSSIKKNKLTEENKDVSLSTLIQKEEPVVFKYITAMVANSMALIFAGTSPSNPDDEEIMKRVTGELQLTAIKTFMMSRELYRQLFNMEAEEVLKLPPPTPDPEPRKE